MKISRAETLAAPHPVANPGRTPYHHFDFASVALPIQVTPIHTACPPLDSGRTRLGGMYAALTNTPHAWGACL